MDKNVSLKHMYKPSRKANKSVIDTDTLKWEPSDWQKRVLYTLQWRQNFWNGDKNWKRAYDSFRGKHWEFGTDDDFDISSDNLREKVTVNVTGSTVLNMVPFLMASMPEFLVKPRKPSDAVSANLQQAVLNYEYQQQEMHLQVKRAVLDSAIIGHGIVKTGFIIDVDQARSKRDGTIDYSDYISRESPYVERINPFRFLFDPNAKNNDLETAQWCAQMFFVPVVDILANDKYDAKIIKRIKDGEFEIKTKDTLDLADQEATLFSREMAFEGDKVGVLYEVWDKKFKKFYVFADGVPEPLMETEWPYAYLHGFPFKKLDFIEIPDCPYGVGIPYSIEDQQFELNRVRTSMFQHRRMFNRKYEAHESIPEEELDKLVDGEDGTIVRVKQMDSIRPIPDAAVTSDTYNLEAIIKQDIQDLTGIDALIRGGQLPSRTTAGEVNARANMFRLKLDDRVEAVDRFVRRIGAQVLDHIKANYLTEKVIELTGEQGRYWQSYTPDQLQADTDISMETIAAPKTDPAIDRQQRLQVLQIAMQSLPLVQSGILQLDMNQLYKWVFESFGQKDMGRFFPVMNQVVSPLEEEIMSDSGEVEESGSSETSGVEQIPEQPEQPSPVQNSGLQVGQLI